MPLMNIRTMLYSCGLLGILLPALAGCGNGSAKQENPVSQASDTKTDGMSREPLTTVQWIDSVRQLPAVREGEKVEVLFRFKNTGTAPLIVHQVTASCGCTVPEKPEAPVTPGGEAFIKALFDSKGRSGTNRKTIDVLTNTAAAITTLSFEVEVKPAAN